jgi:dynein heavy chain
MVVDWSHQVQDVLKKNSAQPLLQGKNPGPLVEIEFWTARRADLESVVDQLHSDKVLKMSYLLEKTLSSYYPSYRSMLQTIDQALQEARDIR